MQCVLRGSLRTRGLTPARRLADKDRPPRIRSALTQAAGLACNSRAWPVGWWSLPAGQTAAPVLPPRKRKAREAGAGGAKEKQGSGPQYVKLRRNEWAPGLRAPKPRNLDLSSVCQCSRPAGAPPPGPGRAKVAAAQRSGCGSDCLNRSMNTFCDPRTCPCGDVCSNRPFQLLPPPKARPLQTQGRGWGLAAAQAVRKGAFVVEYMGEVLNDAMCEQRLWADKVRGETNFYLMEVHRNQVIDAHYKGNTSRLINSACRPNCETQRWVDGASGETRVGIFALRDIADGEEFTCAPPACTRCAVARADSPRLGAPPLQLRLLLHPLWRRRRNLLPLRVRRAQLPGHAGCQPAARTQPGASH
jgi:hypothetical protein